MGRACWALAAALSCSAVPSASFAARATPSWAEYHGERETALAWRALAETRFEDARSHADTATALQPDDVATWEVATRSAMGLRDWPAAYEFVSALRKLTPDDVQGLELLGRVSVELGRGDQARQAFEALVGLQPDLPGPRLGLALVAARVDGSSKDAMAQLATAQRLDPSLDLSTLLLQPAWTPLADDASFVEALNALLASPNENGPPAK